MVAKTITSRQNVTGSTLTTDASTVTTVAIAKSANSTDFRTTVTVVDTSSFPDDGTISFGPVNGLFTFTFKYENKTDTTFTTTEDELFADDIPIGTPIFISDEVTLSSPITPFRDTDGMTGVDEYIFAANDNADNLALGGVNFNGDCSLVMGVPVTESTVNLDSTDNTLTNQNGPYIYSTADPTWTSTTAYSVDDLVTFNGRQYKCTSTVSPGSNALFTLLFDGVAPSTTPNKFLDIAGWTAGNMGSGNYATLTQLRVIFESGGTSGLAIAGGTRSDIFGGLFGATKVEWLDAIVNSTNNGGSLFGGASPEALGFTAARSGNSVIFTAKAGFGNYPAVSSLTVTNGVGVGFDSITTTDEVSNTDPSVDTSRWSDEGAAIVEGWSVNPNSVVPLDPTTGFPGISTRVKCRFPYIYGNTTTSNWTMVNGASTATSPIFYGVDFNVDQGGSMNFIGQADNSFNGIAGTSAPQFHNCTWTNRATDLNMFGTFSDVRFLGSNVLLNGFTYTAYAVGARFEFGIAPKFAARGVSLNAPDVADLRIRAFLMFCQGGGVAANDPDFTYVFENPTAANITIFNSNPGSTINNDADVGVIAVNPVDAPSIPFDTTTGNIATTTNFANIILPSKNNDASFWGSRLSTSPLVVTQRIRIGFPSIGWTVRVVKTASATYTRNDGFTRNVLWQSRERISNGALVRDTANGFNTTAEFFPTSAAAPAVTVNGTTTPGSGGGIQILTVLDTAFDKKKLASNDVPVYYGIDTTAATNSIDLLIPAYSSFPNLTGIFTANDTIYFNSYKIICQHDDYGTQVFNYDFDPAGSNYPTGYQNPAWGNIVETVPESLFDSAFVATAASYTAEINNFQEMYDAIKTYQRERDADTLYNSSHRTSDTTFLTRDSKEFHTIDTNWSRVTSGNSVSSNGTTLSLKTASGFVPGGLTKVDEVEISGAMDMALFPSNKGIKIKCATATNLSGNLEGELTNSAASTTTSALTIKDTGKLTGAWSLAAVTTEANATDDTIFGDSTGAWTTTGVMTLAGRHTGNITGGAGALNHSFTGALIGDLVTTSTGTLSMTGTTTGDVTANSASTITLSGTNAGDVSATSAVATTAATFNQTTSGDFEAGDGAHNIAGNLRNDLTLGAGNSTVSAVIPGDLVIGAGNQTLTATVGGTSGIGAGDLNLEGTYTGRVTAGNATTAYIIDADCNGGLTLGNSPSGTNLIQGTVGNTLVMGTGASTIDAAVTGLITHGNGAVTLNSISGGGLTHGTGSLTLGASSNLTGTLTKSGSGESNPLNISAGATISNIDLVVTTGTLEIYGVSGGFKSVTGNVNFNVASTSTTFQVGSGLPSGRVIFKDRSAAAGTYIMDVAHTTGSVTALGSIVNDSASSTNYDIYYKPTNTFGTDGVFWTTTIVNSDNSATADRTIDVTAVAHAGVLTRAAEDADISGQTAVISTVTTGTTADITIAGAIVQITSPQTQALMLKATDDANYLNLLANNDAEADYIIPLIQSGTDINQGKFTLQAADQQAVTAISGSGTGTLIGTISAGGKTFAAVFVFPNPAGLSGPEAKVACTDAINDNAKIAKTENGVAYNAKQLDNVAFESKYNSSTDYTDFL